MAVERLACGRDPDDVWEGLDRGPDEHERECPTCRAARGSMLKVRDATSDMRERNDAPELAPPAHLASSIKNLARVQVRRDRTFSVIRDDAGELTTSEWAVVQTVRRALEPIQEIRVQRVRISQTPSGGLALTILIVLAFGQRAPKVADEVRAVAEHELRRQLRQAVERVDVRVGDIREW